MLTVHELSYMSSKLNKFEVILNSAVRGTKYLFDLCRLFGYL
jgi:hypothetical protein